ncbi:hypothetical protein PM082_010406 [Marasmius tenuissimus]|nr:hypothetical protein PM082_010406 [Marasmius tenuissimus]
MFLPRTSSQTCAGLSQLKRQSRHLAPVTTATTYTLMKDCFRVAGVVSGALGLILRLLIPRKTIGRFDFFQWKCGLGIKNSSPKLQMLSPLAYITGLLFASADGKGRREHRATSKVMRTDLILTDDLIQNHLQPFTTSSFELDSKACLGMWTVGMYLTCDSRRVFNVIVILNPPDMDQQISSVLQRQSPLQIYPNWVSGGPDLLDTRRVLAFRWCQWGSTTLLAKRTCLESSGATVSISHRPPVRSVEKQAIASSTPIERLIILHNVSATWSYLIYAKYQNASSNERGRERGYGLSSRHCGTSPTYIFTLSTNYAILTENFGSQRRIPGHNKPTSSLHSGGGGPIQYRVRYFQWSFGWIILDISVGLSTTPPSDEEILGRLRRPTGRSFFLGSF